MKTKILPLVAALFCSPITLADQAFFNITVGVPYTVAVRANTFVQHTALTDVKIINIKVNEGSCPIHRLGNIWVSDYAEELRLHKKSLNDAIFKGLVITKKDQTFSLMTTCKPEQINSVEITTDKGIQTVRFDMDVEPVITVKPLSEKKEVQTKKADPSVLDTIYKVSNYTCYQTKDEIEGVIELCSPLPANNVSEFTLPYGSLMSKPLFVERAKERARKARYIELLETFPTEILEFKEKRLPPVAIPSMGDIIGGGRKNLYDELTEKLRRAENKVDEVIKIYESSLRELVRLKIDMPNLEAKVVNGKKAAARIAKALEKNPGDQRLIENAKEAEDRILWDLGELERFATRIPQEEKDFAKNKIRVQDIQNEVIQLREEVKQYLDNNPSDAQ